jgi:hypothetical protein
MVSSEFSHMPGIAKRIQSTRQQVVTLTGEKGAQSSDLEACEGKSPHGFIGQEAKVVDGIARFIKEPKQNFGDR